MRNRIRFFNARDLDHSLGDERPRDTRPEKILAFVNRAGLKNRKNKIAREFFLKILDHAFGSTGPQRLVLETGKLLFLSDVGAEGNDLRLIVFFQPAKND